jgi:hypothetical protein
MKKIEDFQILTSIRHKNSKKISSSLKPRNGKVLRVFHQNVKALRNKTNELISSTCPCYPHILYLTEHYMKELELEHTHIENYKLGAKYCRKILEKGGMSTFIHKNLKLTNINSEDYCKHEVREACALQLESTFLIFVH